MSAVRTLYTEAPRISLFEAAFFFRGGGARGLRCAMRTAIGGSSHITGACHFQRRTAVTSAAVAPQIAWLRTMQDRERSAAIASYLRGLYGDIDAARAQRGEFQLRADSAPSATRSSRRGSAHARTPLSTRAAPSGGGVRLRQLYGALCCCLDASAVPGCFGTLWRRRPEPRARLHDDVDISIAPRAGAPRATARRCRGAREAGLATIPGGTEWVQPHIELLAGLPPAGTRSDIAARLFVSAADRHSAHR